MDIPGQPKHICLIQTDVRLDRCNHILVLSFFKCHIFIFSETNFFSLMTLDKYRNKLTEHINQLPKIVFLFSHKMKLIVYSWCYLLLGGQARRGRGNAYFLGPAVLGTLLQLLLLLLRALLLWLLLSKHTVTMPRVCCAWGPVIFIVYFKVSREPASNILHRTHYVM